MPTTERLDERLVAALCRDGRADVRDVASETGTVPTTVQNRLRELESEGIIEGYTAQLDYEMLGYVTVILHLGVDLDAIDTVCSRLRERSTFVTVYRTCGSERVFAIGKFGSEAAVGACLRELHDDADIRWVDADTVVSVRLEGACPIPEG